MAQEYAEKLEEVKTILSQITDEMPVEDCQIMLGAVIDRFQGEIENDAHAEVTAHNLFIEMTAIVDKKSCGALKGYVHEALAMVQDEYPSSLRSSANLYNRMPGK